MIMELNLYSAGIEVTRKCNMQCEHCLRGAAQRKTISDHHIYRFFSLIDSISTLTITGGEPTLAMDSLEQIKHRIQYESCDVGSFYMVTNGKSINVERLAEWTADMKFVCSDNDISSIGFSFDQFHTSTFNWKQLQKQKRNYVALQEILEEEYGIDNSANHSFVYKHSDEKWTYDRLLQQGRAEDFGSIEPTKELFEIDNDDDDNYFCVNDGILYLSCNGYIVAGCNWSYNTIDNDESIRIAHIDDLHCTDDLIEAIKAYNKKYADNAELQEA